MNKNRFSLKTALKNWSNSQIGATALIIGAMLMPLILDSACIWDLRRAHIIGGGGYAICKTGLINAIFIGGLFLVFGRLVKWMCFPLLWIMTIVASSEIFCKTFFGFNFEGDWILLLLESSSSEMKLLVQQYFTLPTAMVTIVVLLVAIASTFMLSCVKVVKRSVLCYLAGIVLMLPVIKREINADSWGFCFGSIQTKRVLADTIGKMRMYKDLFTISQKPNINGNPTIGVGAEDILGLIIIGESATRNSMSLYGYERKTTPCLDGIANELYVFKDVVTAWGNTPMACRFILTEATLAEPTYAYCTLPQVIRKAGAESCLVSNQGRWGAYGHVCGYLFDDCRPSVYLPKLSSSRSYDSDVLAHLKSLSVSNRFVFVHLSGSHFPPDSTYPAQAAVFAGGTKMDLYDNSLHFTDKVLFDMIDWLKKERRPSFVFYLSDHGETPRAETWRDPNHRDLWEVPMLVWLSQEYKSRFGDTASRLQKALDKPIQTDRIFKLILSLAQIDGFVGHCKEDDILADGFDGHEKRLQGSHHR